MADKNNPHTAPPPDAVRAFAHEMISRYGVRRAALELGVTRHAITAAAAGARIHAGTRLQMTEAARARGIL